MSEGADQGAERGYVGIQTEGKAFDFRNLRLQELPPSQQPGRQ